MINDIFLLWSGLIGLNNISLIFATFITLFIFLIFVEYLQD